jgi:hypothetical protein
MFRTAIVGLAMAAMMDAAHAAQASRQFSCSGNMIEQTGLAPSPKSGRLILTPTNKVLLDLGQGEVKARVMSDNKIQLKFSTKEFVGEFFHYTGDLFLIYKPDHLARLTCTPNQRGSEAGVRRSAAAAHRPSDRTRRRDVAR